MAVEISSSSQFAPFIGPKSPWFGSPNSWYGPFRKPVANSQVNFSRRGAVRIPSRMAASPAVSSKCRVSSSRVLNSARLKVGVLGLGKLCRGPISTALRDEL